MKEDMENDPSDMKGWKEKARDFITAHENDDWGTCSSLMWW